MEGERQKEFERDMVSRFVKPDAHHRLDIEGFARIIDDAVKLMGLFASWHKFPDGPEIRIMLDCEGPVVGKIVCDPHGSREIQILDAVISCIENWVDDHIPLAEV